MFVFCCFERYNVGISDEISRGYSISVAWIVSQKYDNRIFFYYDIWQAQDNHVSSLFKTVPVAKNVRITIFFNANSFFLFFVFAHCKK